MWLTHKAGKTVPAKKTRAWRENLNIKRANKSALRQSRKAETQAWEMTSERTLGYRTTAAGH